MKWSVRLIKIKGISLFLHATLLFFPAWLLVLFLAHGMQAPQLAWSLLYLVLLLASVFLHELGHALTAAVFGINAKAITLYPMGGIASIEKLPQNPTQELLISVAGPAVNGLLAVFFWLLSGQQNLVDTYHLFNGEISATNLFAFTGLSNLLLAVLNLIPAFPLDGGRIIRALLAFRMNYINASAAVAKLSKAVAVVFIVYGLVSLYLIFSLAGLFILVFARAEEAYLQLKLLLQGLHVRDMVMYEYNSLDSSLTARDAATVLQHNYNKRFLVMERGLPVGTLHRMSVIKAIAEQHYDQRISLLLKKDLQPLEGSTDVGDVLQLLSSNEQKLFPVFQNGVFTGVINFQHVIEYLLLHKTNTKDFAKTKSLVELV